MDRKLYLGLCLHLLDFQPLRLGSEEDTKALERTQIGAEKAIKFIYPSINQINYDIVLVTHKTQIGREMVNVQFPSHSLNLV